jgi:hypothetical protein
MQTIKPYQGQLSSRASSIRELGEKEATRHRPPTSATHPDAHEVELRTDVEQLVANEQTLFDAVVSDCNRNALEAGGKLLQLKADIDAALADDTLDSQVEADLSSERGRLVELTAQRIRAEVEWRGFRASNGITDMPNYPESQIFHWAVIAVLVLVETGVNAFFYQNANGLIGGFIVAAAVAVVNMGSAAALGSLFRRKNLKDPVQRYLGWFYLVLFIPLTIFCNALFAAFRSAYELVSDPTDSLMLAEAFRGAWSEAARIFIFDFRFGDFASFILFMTGFILSWLAFWKGYTSDDPFPGYSRRDRELKKAKEAEAAAFALAKQKLQTLLQNLRGRVQGLSSEPGSQIKLLSMKLSSLGSAEKELPTRAEAIQRDYHLLLETYRQANLAVRGTEPPAYFANFPAVAERVNGSGAIGTRADLQREIEELENLQSAYRDRLNSKLKELQGQSSQILSATFDRFRLGVEKDAEQQVQKDIQIMPSAT